MLYLNSEFFCSFKDKVCGWVMAQWIQCLSCKHEDQSSELEHPLTCQADVAATCFPMLGRWILGIPAESWLSSTAEYEVMEISKLQVTHAHVQTKADVHSVSRDHPYINSP